ncbi:MAG: rhomboid family intramembrane serine protease [Haloarculaceae archaeon]
MAKCDVCGRSENMPYHCRHCGGTYCAEHRLPENHDCPGLQNWNDPGGVFDSGFDDSVAGQSGSQSVLSRLGLSTSAGGPLAYFRGNASYLFLAIMIVVFPIELVVRGQSVALFQSVFVLTSAHWYYAWTWVTSVFSHGSFIHLFGNGIVLFFFGPFLEQRIGTKRFAALFLVSGVLAGLAQIGFGFLAAAVGFGSLVPGVLGASGAIMAILGVITVLNPDLRVYLYFILPVPIWVLTLGYAGLSVLGVLSQGNILSNIAHFAHLTGLLIGLAYGQRVKSELSLPRQLQFGAGGPGGPGRRF